MKKYQLYVQECDIRKDNEHFNGGKFEAENRKEAFKKIKPLNIEERGRCFYFFEEIEEQQKPVIRRVVAV